MDPSIFANMPPSAFTPNNRHEKQQQHWQKQQQAASTTTTDPTATATSIPSSGDGSGSGNGSGNGSGSTGSATGSVGSITVKNSCSFTVGITVCYQPFESTPAGCRNTGTIESGSSYSETYETNQINDGQSIKLWNSSQDMNDSNQIQCEYTPFGTEASPGTGPITLVNYDISEVNGANAGFHGTLSAAGGAGTTYTTSDNGVPPTMSISESQVFTACG